MSRTWKPGWFRGSATDLKRRDQLIAFLLLLVAAASLCFSQYGIVTFGDDPAVQLCFVFFLVPIALCAVMLGIVPGLILAFATGVLIMLRCQWTPTNYYDVHLVDPLLSVVSILVGALFLAVLSAISARRWPADLSKKTSLWKHVPPARIAALIIGCFLAAAAFSYGTRGLMYLIVAPGSAEGVYGTTVAGYLVSMTSPFVFLEVLINAAVLSIACVVSVAFDAHRRSGAWKSGLSATFTRWLALAIVMVFLAASSVSFCVETVRATREADTLLVADLEYLQHQVADREETGAPVEPVASGYNTVYGGVVVIVHNGEVVSSSDPDMIGMSVSEVLGSQYEGNYEAMLRRASRKMLTGSDETGTFYGVRALIDGDYAFIVDAPLEAMYQSRKATVMYNASFLVPMLIVIFFVVRLLLRRIVVAPIRRTNKTLGQITDGELTRRVNERGVREFDSLSTGINKTVAALRDTIAEVERKNEQDITAGKAIQESTLPREFPPFPDIDRFDIYASMKPARGVGGDFYDFFLIEDDKLGFLLADVSGKGIPAALFMMAAKTQIRNYLASGLSVDEAVNAANHQLCIGNDAGMFVTAWIGVLNYQTGELAYTNCGHNPPLLHHGGSWTWKRETSGMPLGLFDVMPYDKYICELEPGDTLYLYTDGVTEAMNVDGKLFGEERLEETLDSFVGMNARSVSLGVSRAVTDFALGAEQSDDISMVTLRYGVPPEKRAIMTLPASDKQLIHVRNFIHEELYRRGAPKSAFNPLDIAAEELFVNVCHYAYPEATPDDPGEVRIEFEYEANPPSLTVKIEDDGVPYDPLAYPEAQTPDDIDSVPTGGLGILMAKRSVDDMHYERVDGSNVLTFRKGW